jgi:nucleoside-diphosphate-sugar epimerase
MAALVTGASGFVGRHLVQALVEHGRQVRALTRRPLDHGLPAGAEALSVDVNDEAGLVAAMGGVTTVYHAAGVVPARGSAGMWETNVGGTCKVAQASLRAGVRRLVLVSSVAAYRPPLDDVVAEPAPTGGADLYGRSKAEAEAQARRICAHGLELVIVRPCQTYGPGDASGYTRRLLRLAASPLLPVAGWRGRAFSLIHVRDVVAALRAAGELDAAGGAVFNIAPGSGVSLPELARILASLRRGRIGMRVPIPALALRAALSLRAMAAGRSQAGGPAWKSYAAGHTHGSLLLGGPLYDSSSARAVLGFHATTTPERGLSELLARPGRE